MRPGCKARVEGDEYYCRACGVRWGIQDPDEPPCQTGFTAEDLRRQKEYETQRELEKLYGETDGAGTES